MEQLQDQDLCKLKELLRHTGEFIAYFELAESKMMSWREEISLHIQSQYEQIDHQLGQLHQELASFQEVLTQAGIARLKLHADSILKTGAEQLTLFDKLGQHLIEEIGQQYGEFQKNLTRQIQSLDHHCTQAIHKIDQQLAGYDVNHFKRIANESCAQVEKVANKVIKKSSGYLHSFQGWSIFLAFTVTLIVTFFLGLYINNELPWEMHQEAKNEREAGRVLLKAWPSLSQQERIKILKYYPLKKG